MNNSKNIIKGYKGVMDLDLTDIEPCNHKSLTEQHYKDINLYKIEQAKLKPKLRYENDVGMALKRIEYDNKMRSLKLYKKKDKTQDIIDLENEIYRM
tara:strand:+ start:264 stop:554 length:291 start_codon:yes stop_codon:yes gene_type:complete